MLSLFAYLDYRDFLKDHFDMKKSESSLFSYRYVASKTGIDASYYVKILNKQKHVGETKIEPLSDFLGLEGREREYFSVLIRFNRAKDPEQEQTLFSRLMTLKNSAGVEIEDYRYFASWFTIPIREMLNNYDFSDDYKALGQQLNPVITEREAERAIETLKSLKMISADENGYWRPTEQLLTTGDQWRSVGVREFQKQMITLAARAIDEVPKEERDISSVTVSTSRACLEAIRDRLAAARREILEMIAAEEQVDGVYQINLQVFPLSQQEVEA